MKITCTRKRSRLATLLLALVLVPAMMLGVVSTLSQPAKADTTYPIHVTNGTAKLGGTQRGSCSGRSDHSACG